MSIRNMFALALLAASGVWAQVPDAPQSQDEASARRARAEAMRGDAGRALAAEQAACRERFLVNDCLEKAQKAHTRKMIEARTLEQGARDYERAAKRREVEAGEAARAAELSGRAAAQEADGERHRAEEARRAEARERKLAEKEAQAAEGRRQMAAEQAARKARLEARARKDAARAAR